MKNMLQTAGAFSKKAGRSVRRNARRFGVGAALVATSAAANAQTAANGGVAEIVDAIDALKPDMAFVVTAAIGLALIGMGAVAAIALAKRLMGK